jgi:hypothetical protein
MPPKRVAFLFVGLRSFPVVHGCATSLIGALQFFKPIDFDLRSVMKPGFSAFDTGQTFQGYAIAKPAMTPGNHHSPEQKLRGYHGAYLAPHHPKMHHRRNPGHHSSR